MLRCHSNHPGPVRRLAVAVVVVMAWFVMGQGGRGVGRPARAQAEQEKGQAQAVSSQARCQAAYQLGQKKAEAGRLVEASRLFASCADLTCGDEIWQSCVEENGELHAALPSIIPFAVDGEGTARADVQVILDGHPIARRLSGVAIPVDPGPHELAFSIASRVFATETITAAEGERSRPLSVTCPLTEDQQGGIEEHRN
jgi:hypothetical protein